MAGRNAYVNWTWFYGVSAGVALSMACAASNEPDTIVESPTVAATGGTVAPVTPDSEALSDFARRVHGYMELHDVLQQQGAPQEQGDDVTENLASQEALAARIRHARRDTRQGDIFTPAIAATLRRAMNPEVRGVATAGMREAIRDGTPPDFTLTVNRAYPAGAPRSMMPGRLLRILPRLPQGLEYRIVHTNLILLDVDANIVVDYLFDVMCAHC